MAAYCLVNTSRPHHKQLSGLCHVLYCRVPAHSNGLNSIIILSFVGPTTILFRDVCQVWERQHWFIFPQALAWPWNSNVCNYAPPLNECGENKITYVPFSPQFETLVLLRINYYGFIVTQWNRQQMCYWFYKMSGWTQLTYPGYLKPSALIQTNSTHVKSIWEKYM